MGFRRRRVGRLLLRRRGIRRPLARKILRELRRAHELEAQGKHLEAAALFEQLASNAQARGLPQYLQLLLQAGKSHIQGGQDEKGIEQVRTALGGLVERGRLERVAHLQPGLQALFLERGLESAWKDIQDTLPQVGSVLQTRPAAGNRLPAKCPYCGASLVPEALDEMSSEGAVCGYCGSYVQAGDSTS